MKKALITGITGQDGSYLAEFLLVKVNKTSIRRGESREKYKKVCRVMMNCDKLFIFQK